VRLVVVDESHTNFTPAAIRMLEAFRTNGAKVVGMTATPRAGKKESLSDWYGQCAFTYLYQQARDDGYLVPVKIWLSILDALDLSKIPTSCGDYNGEQLARWLKQEGPLQAVSSLVEQTYDGKPSMVFTKSIDQAEMLSEILRRRGVSCSVVHSDTSRLPEEERRRNLADFEAGKTDVIVNVECLALGWDCPKVQKIYIARPTQSMDLYGQIFGRGTRPLPGIVDGLKTAEERRAAIAASEKPYFEIYDLCDVTRHNKLVTASDFLNPGMDQKLQRRVRDRQVQATAGVANLDAMVEEERKRLAQEQAALDMIEMSRRAQVKADAEYRLVERDAFAPVEREERRRRYSVMLWGKYKRRPFHEVPTQYIRWTLENCKAPQRHPGYFPALRSEIARRMTGMR
jgi:superfamily II DNA or RNA helicase